MSTVKEKKGHSLVVKCQGNKGIVDLFDERFDNLVFQKFRSRKRLDEATTWKYRTDADEIYVHLNYKNENHYLQIDYAPGTMKLISKAQFNGETVPSRRSARKAAHDASAIRETMIAAADYEIHASDKKQIPVHSLVLRTYWELFRDQYDEKASVVNLEHPACDVENATDVLIMADTYGVAELAAMAADEVLKLPQGSLELSDLVSSWQAVRKVKNDDVKTFFAAEIAAKKPQVKDAKQAKALFSELSSEDALELYFETLNISK
ncbi:hypothetical protein CJU89_6157 [Yarrowia sp. B02]|nr:hypothetical protein CJU89_6157 [Yarrowia sp. B02]